MKRDEKSFIIDRHIKECCWKVHEKVFLLQVKMLKKVKTWKYKRRKYKRWKYKRRDANKPLFRSSHLLIKIFDPCLFFIITLLLFFFLAFKKVLLKSLFYQLWTLTRGLKRKAQALNCRTFFQKTHEWNE